MKRIAFLSVSFDFKELILKGQTQEVTRYLGQQEKRLN
jgi:hypothetical protein